MTTPSIEILGVYALTVTAEFLQQQTDILYGDDLPPNERREAEEQCNEQLSSTMLVEVLVRNRDDRFSMNDFCQPLPSVPKQNWQVAWAEAFLAVDGESLIAGRWSKAPANRDFRVAFFIHFWVSTQPLRTSYGDLKCPSVQPMPDRLSRLVPYMLPD